VVVTVNPLPTPVSGPSSVCVGQTITLTDGTAGGVWTSSNITIATVGSSSGIVTGVGAGVDTITYTLGSGCIATKVITVNPLAPISGPTALCQGLSYTFSDAVAGGTWSSSNTSVVTIGSSTGIATGGTSTGVATISYILPTGCTTTITVTVNALAPINGTHTLCVGSTAIFTDALTGGTWSSSTPSVGTVSTITGVVGGVSAGTTTISYNMPNGCSATFIVTVAVVAPITGPSSVCQGDSITLADATPSGVWSSSDTTVATISTTGVVTSHNSGTVIISYSYGPGCRATKSIDVYPSTPILGNLNVCLGLTSALSDTTLGGTWSISPTSIATIDPYGVVTGGAVGTATVTYTTITGCVRTAP
jgi:uncharacterized protein YjdB